MKVFATLVFFVIVGLTFAATVEKSKEDKDKMPSVANNTNVLTPSASNNTHMPMPMSPPAVPAQSATRDARYYGYGYYGGYYPSYGYGYYWG